LEFQVSTYLPLRLIYLTESVTKYPQYQLPVNRQKSWYKPLFLNMEVQKNVQTRYIVREIRRTYTKPLNLLMGAAGTWSLFTVHCFTYLLYLQRLSGI